MLKSIARRETDGLDLLGERPCFDLNSRDVYRGSAEHQQQEMDLKAQHEENRHDSYLIIKKQLEEISNPEEIRGTYSIRTACDPIDEPFRRAPTTFRYLGAALEHEESFASVLKEGSNTGVEAVSIMSTDWGSQSVQAPLIPTPLPSIPEDTTFQRFLANHIPFSTQENRHPIETTGNGNGLVRITEYQPHIDPSTVLSSTSRKPNSVKNDRPTRGPASPLPLGNNMSRSAKGRLQSPSPSSSYPGQRVRYHKARSSVALATSTLQAHYVGSSISRAGNALSAVAHSVPGVAGQWSLSHRNDAIVPALRQNPCSTSSRRSKARVHNGRSRKGPDRSPTASGPRSTPVPYSSSYSPLSNTPSNVPHNVSFSFPTNPKSSAPGIALSSAAYKTSSHASAAASGNKPPSMVLRGPQGWNCVPKIETSRKSWTSDRVVADLRHQSRTDGLM